MAWPAIAAQNKDSPPIDADCPEGFVKQIEVIADRALDCSSMKSIVDTATRDCKTNDEKASAIYNAARFLWYHHQYPGEEGGIASLKMINVYGWSLCGGQHTVLAALWRAAGWGWPYVGWEGHTTVECRYEDKWHYFDTFLKVYAFKSDHDRLGDQESFRCIGSGDQKGQSAPEACRLTIAHASERSGDAGIQISDSSPKDFAGSNDRASSR